MYRLSHEERGDIIFLSLKGRYHILSPVRAANEGQNMISSLER